MLYWEIRPPYKVFPRNITSKGPSEIDLFTPIHTHLSRKTCHINTNRYVNRNVPISLDKINNLELFGGEGDIFY